MSDWTLVTSICTRRGCQLVYRSTDGLIGMVRTSGGRQRDRTHYFLWHLPDSASEYATEAEARTALHQEHAHE